MDRNARRWWTAALAIAAVAGVLGQRLSAQHPQPSHRRFVKAELPAAWRSLPVTATLTDEVVTRHVDEGCGEGHGSIAHEATLGRFSVGWSELVYKGLDAGSQGWRARDTRTGTDCPALAEQTYGQPGPDTMREDAATGVYVLVSHGKAVAACREDVLVAAPAS